MIPVSLRNASRPAVATAATAATFTGLAYLTAFLTPQPMPVLGALTGLVLCGLHLTAGRRPPVAWGVVAGMGVFLAWGLLTVLWSVAPDETLKKAGQLAGTLLLAVVLLAAARALPEAARPLVRRAAVAGGIGLVVLVALEGYGGHPYRALIHDLGWADDVRSSALNRSVLVMVLLSWPAALAAVRLGRPRLAAALPVAAAVVTLGLESGTAQVAALAGLTAGAAGLILRGRPLLAPVAAAGFAAVAAVAVPVAALLWDRLGESGLPASLRHRFFIWDFAADRIAEAPLTGWGLGVSRAMPNFGVVSPFTPASEPVIPLHTHNAYLQVMLETGLIGYLLAAGFVGWLILRTARWPGAAERLCAIGLLAAIAGAWLTGYGVWQSWWIATLAVAAFVTAAVSRPA